MKAFVFSCCVQHNNVKINFTAPYAKNNAYGPSMHCFP